MKCTGQCRQGRDECPQRAICELADGVSLREVLPALLWPVGMVVIVAVGATLWRMFA